MYTFIIGYILAYITFMNPMLINVLSEV